MFSFCRINDNRAAPVRKITLEGGVLKTVGGGDLHSLNFLTGMRGLK
jgi:hypothetical protein